MATKKFIIEVKTGMTDCANCLMECDGRCPSTELEKMGLVCDVFNLATMKIKGPISYEELREFANQYSHNIWEQLMQRFKADDKFCIGANDVSDYVLNAILDTYQKMMEEEK